MASYSEILDSGKVVLVEFYASWCPHCQRMMPIVDQIKMLLDGRVPVYQFDIDENQELAESQGADSIPTFIIYRDGEEVWRHTGEIAGETLLGEVESFL